MGLAKSSRSLAWAAGALAATVLVAAAGASAADDVGRAYDGPPPPELPEIVSRDEQGRATLRAVRLDEPLVVDGRLDEAIYHRVRGAGGFVQQEPHEGEPATEPTEVWVFFDRQNVYVAARCWDSHPERIVANEMRRDNFGIFNNDNLAVIFDTFYDRRNAFFFYTNPIGGLFDGLITDERGVNRDWNTVWDAKTARFEQGWTVEMVFPFKSLRYKGAGPQIWGINFRRVVRWKNELSYFTRVPASLGPRGITKVSSAATLVGIETPPRSMNLELKPYAISGATTDRAADPPRSNDLEADAGLDAKIGLTRGLVLDLTYNTDFAQVEVDEQQVNLTRFSLFFPEKREFFLEGQGIFRFGEQQGGGGRGPRGFRPPSNTPLLFFSRQIGIAEGKAVPILGGGRLSGRVGPYSIGALAIATEEHAATGAPATTFSVLRLKRDVLRRSTIGLIATVRDPADGTAGTNRALGVDANLAFYENVRANLYYAETRTPGLSGDEASYRGQFEYDGDRYGLELERLVVEENFNPEIGFLRRRNFRRSFVQARFSPRPRSIEAIRKLTWEASLDYITDNEGRLETRLAELSFQTDFESSDRLQIDYTRSFEFLPEPFEIAEGVVLPVDEYRFQDVRLRYSLGPQRRVSGTFGVQTGSFFSGDRTELSYGGRIELGPRASVEPSISWNFVDLAEGSFTTRLVSTRVTFTISPRSFVGGLVQYNSAAEAVSANLRFRWEYEPGSDLFVVYSEERDTLARGFPGLENRSLVVKFTRLLRF